MNDDVERPPLLRAIVSRVVSRLSLYIRRVRIALNINIKYQYNGFFIELPAEHLLPMYQKHHRLYDRFLPHICKYLAPGSIVVDVGANCGDTVAAMYESNKGLVFICVEPDEVFFKFLQKNVSRIRASDKQALIKTIKSLVGRRITSASLEGAGGTRRAIVDDRETSKIPLIKARSLDDILSQCEVTNIRLLKSDVDGFDYDVIDSAESTLDAEPPIIFFECRLDHEFQKAGYEKTMANLETKGYGEWVLLDNCGEVVLHTSDIKIVNQLLDYVWRQNTGHSTRTIYYYDILAVTKRDSALMGRVIDDYIAAR
jgi:FkbM family methyltransferase